MPAILFIAKVVFTLAISGYVAYGLAFGVAAIFRRPGGEH